MQFIHPTYLDDIISASDNMSPQPAEAMVASTPLRIFQEATSQLQHDLEISSFQSYLILLFLAIIAGYLLGKLTIWGFNIILHIIQNIIRQCLSGAPAMSGSSSSSASSKMAEEPMATKREEDAQVPTTPPAMQSNAIIPQQLQEGSNSHGSGQSNNSKAPSPKAIVVTYHRIHKRRGQKHKAQRQGDRHYKPTRNAPGGTIQVFLFDHAKMHAYTSGYNANCMAWVVISTVVAALAIAFLIKG
ncbi:hypothetical protein F4775DRAFT_84996 [Biscogniauxia sp. FL1348]|nr:hypothetical protein F4775DRAFT_84996 [Biscogniauxia sp. FL1348]